jgi:phosphatidylinositol kinase/protein kinase (PI-3  family)
LKVNLSDIFPWFVLSSPLYNLGTPGFNVNFESAPFKLTSEYLELMGGFSSSSDASRTAGPQSEPPSERMASHSAVNSEAFMLFQDLFLKGFLALQKHADGITSIVQVIFKYFVFV